MCITNSSMYSGLLSGCIHIASEVIISLHVPVGSLICVKQLLSPYSKNLIHHAVLPLQQMLECSKSSVETGLYARLPLKSLYLFCSLHKML